MNNIAIITLKEKYKRMTSNNERIYYLITYNLQKALTSKYFELIGEKYPTLTSNKKSLFLFNDKKKWANSLKEKQVYLVSYTSVNKNNSKYLHVKDWKILGDKMTVERSWRIISNSKINNIGI